MKNGNQPAYPIVVETATFPDSGKKEYGIHNGISKREMFAMAAMQGMCHQYLRTQKEELAKHAIEFADELLSELEKTGT